MEGDLAWDIAEAAGQLALSTRTKQTVEDYSDGFIRECRGSFNIEWARELADLHNEKRENELRRKKLLENARVQRKKYIMVGKKTITRDK